MSRQPTTQDKALMAGLFWQGWLINGRPATWDDMTPNERARSEVEWRRYLVKYSEDQPRVPAGDPAGGEFAGGSGGASSSGGGDVSPEHFGAGQKFEALNQQIEHAIQYERGFSEKASDAEKAKIQGELSKRLASNPAWQAAGYESQDVRNLMNTWAGTSGDTNSKAVAMQLAVRDEFQLTGAITDHLVGPGTAYPSEADVWRHASDEVPADKLKAAYQAYARAEYDNTQAWLRAKGITQVAVFRGVTDTKVLDGEKKDYVVKSTGLQPASSFSSTREKAEGFVWGMHTGRNYPPHTAMLATVFPASAVLSTARSGRGVWDEGEVIVLGRPGRGVFMHSSPDHMPSASKIDWGTGKSSASRLTRAAIGSAIELDALLDNADWPKQSWDLPPYKSAAFNAIGFDLTNFRKLPVYVNAVKNGLIKDDEWVAKKAMKSVGLLTKYSEDQPRVPAGDPAGGQFTSGGGSSANDHVALPDAARGGGTPFESEADFHASVQQEIHDAKWNYGKVTEHEEDKTFELAGRQYFYSGAAHVDERDPQKGTIDLYHNRLTKETLPGVFAHEMEHIKFQTALDAYGKERDKMNNDSRDLIRPSGELRPGFEHDYPIYAMFQPHWEDTGKLAKSDGVTDYSRAYWSEWNAGKASSFIAIHETLAEMSRVKRETGKLPGSVGWKGLHKVVDKVFKMKGGV